MKFKFTVISILVAAVLSLTACASMPDLTEEQEELVSEYATALLLKYDSENHSRLVDTTEFKASYEAAVAQYEAEEAAYYKAKQQEEDKRRAEAMAQEAANSTSATDSASTGSTSSKNDGTGGATVIDKSDIESVLGLDNISIDFSGYELTDVYPGDEDDLMLSITASKKYKLLVLHFNVKNNSSQDREIDFVSLDYPLKISINGKGYKLPLHTLVLEDDINLFKGVIKAGSGKDFVLIFEVPNDTNIETLNLRASYNGKSATRILK